MAQEQVSKKRPSKKQIDELLIDDSEQQIYKTKLRAYVLSGQIKELYGKIITESELNNMSETACESVYKTCELKLANNISDSVVGGIITIAGKLFTKALPIENKDKYISELKSDYIINSELKHIAGNVAMRTGKLIGLLSFIIITASNISLNKKTHELEQELNQELEQELDQELEQEK